MNDLLIQQINQEIADSRRRIERLEKVESIAYINGSNAGTTTLIAGTKVVNTLMVTANSIILLTPQSLGTIARPVGVGVTARVAGVSFTIMSMDITDTSVIGWIIVEP
jgi:hypothetical protein